MFFTLSIYNSVFFNREKMASAVLPKLVLMFTWTYPTWLETDDNVTVVAHSQGLAKYWSSRAVTELAALAACLAAAEIGA